MLFSTKILLSCVSGLIILLFGAGSFEEGQWVWAPQWVRTHEIVEYDDIKDVIGIHLGRTYSQVGIIRKNLFEMIVDGQNRSQIPSYVAFPDHRAPLVGFAAKEQASQNSQGTIYDVRSLIGRNFSDPGLKDDIKNLPYKVVDNNGLPFIEVHTNGTVLHFSPENITAMLVSNLKMMAETYLDTTIKHAVITVPSNFEHDLQRQATIDAAVMAGLNVLRTWDEWKSASVAFETDRPRRGKGLENCEECLFILYNIGEEGSELVLASDDEGVLDQLATISDKSLDGNAFQRELSSPARLLGSPFGVGRVLDHFYPKAEQAELTNLDDHSSSYRALALVKTLLEKGGLVKNQINWLIFTGNPKQVAVLKPVIEAYFDGKKSLSNSLWKADIIPEDEAIVRGASRMGEILSYSHNPVALCSMTYDVIDLSLGIATVGDVFTKMIPGRNQVIPTRKSRSFTTASNNQSRVILKILEGERTIASKNTQIGTLELTGLPPKPRNELEIKVTFEVDRNERLKILAEEMDSGTKAEIIIDERSKDRHGWEEIEKLVQDGETNFEEDQLLWKMPGNRVLSKEELEFGVVAV